MKYIDADRLIAELERQNADKKIIQPLIRLIDSLQQEQEQYVIGGQVFGATDVNQLYEGKVYIISNLVQDTEFGLSVRDKVKMLLMKD